MPASARSFRTPSCMRPFGSPILRAPSGAVDGTLIGPMHARPVSGRQRCLNGEEPRSVARSESGRYGPHFDMLHVVYAQRTEDLLGALIERVDTDPRRGSLDPIRLVASSRSVEAYVKIGLAKARGI